MLWLDHIIFGNGYGLRSPHCDNRFFWLDGRLYTWIGGHGAQLQGIQWRHPRVGERRMLCGLEFRPFNSTRSWFRVRVSWATRLPDNLGDANDFLRDMERFLGGVMTMRPHLARAATPAPEKTQKEGG